jgi:uncharacterized protein (TIRG00374 family)
MKIPVINRVRVEFFLKKVCPIIGLIAYIYILYTIGFEKIINIFFKFPIYLVILIPLLTIPKAIIKTYQWSLVLKKQKIEMKFKRALKLNFMAWFFGLVSPWKMGNFITLMYVKEETNEPYGKLFVNNFICRILNSFAFYLIAIIGLILVYPTFPLISIIVGVYILANVVFYLLLLKKKRGEKIVNAIIKIFFIKKIRKNLLKFASTFYLDFPRFRDLIKPGFIGFGILAINCLQLYLIVNAVGIQISFLTILVLHFIAGFVSYIPGILFEGLGYKEIGLIFLYGLFGVSAETAVVVGLTHSFLVIYTASLYGGVFALHESLKKRSIKHKKSPMNIVKNPIFNKY